MEQLLTDPNNSVETLPRRSRLILIRKILNVVVPQPDNNANSDARMLEFTEYAKFVERKAFERASCRDDYYAILASIIYRMQRKLEFRPKGPENDPYSNIPLPNELPDFLGLKQEQMEEFLEEQNPERPYQERVKAHLTRKIRSHVIDKLVALLFPPPDPFAKYDGRMDKLFDRLKVLETEAYEEARDRQDYYNKASVKAYRLQKTMKKNGENYIERRSYYSPVPSPPVESEPEVVEVMESEDELPEIN